MALWSELAATLDWNRAVGVWSAPIDAPNVEKFMSEAGATADVLGVSRDMSEWEEGLLYLIGVKTVARVRQTSHFKHHLIVV